MRKQLIAIAGVVSLGFSASAGNWFDAGISGYSDWPTDGSNKVIEGQGTWTNTASAHLESLAGLTFETDNDKPLTFEAATAKTLGNETKSVEILSAIVFTPFAEAPEVPAGAKAGAIVVNGYFHVLAKDGDANAWTNTGIAATASTTEIRVLLTNERKAIYTFDSKSSFAVDIVVDDDEVSKANYVGDGSVSVLSATYELCPITFTLAPPANAKVDKVMNGGEVLNEPYQVVPGTTVTVTYKANEGWLFANGKDAMNADVTVNETGAQPTPKGTETSEGKARIGTTYYLTLQVAFSAAKVGETVELLADNAEAYLTIPAEVTLNLAAFGISTNGLVNNGIIVVNCIQQAVALKDVVGTLKAGADLNSSPAMFYPQGTVVTLTTTTVYPPAHTNIIPRSVITVGGGTGLVWNQGINPYQQVYVTGNATFGGDVSPGWDGYGLTSVLCVTGDLALVSNIAIGANAEMEVTGTITGDKTITLKDVKSKLTYAAGTGITVTTDMEGYKVVKTGSVYEIKAIGPEPVVPGGEIDVPQGKSAEDFAKDITTNATLKAQYLKAPGDVETTAGYRACFDAVATGDTTVSFVLNETGTNAVVTATATAEAAALAVALSATETVLTIDEPLVGFYYSLKQGGEVGSLGFKTEATDKNQLCDGTTISFTLNKPTGKGFYQTIVTPTTYVDPE